MTASAWLMCILALLPPALVVTLFSQLSPFASGTAAFLVGLSPGISLGVAAVSLLFVALLLWLDQGENNSTTVVSLAILVVGAVFCFPLFPLSVPAAIVLATPLLLYVAVRHTKQVECEKQMQHEPSVQFYHCRNALMLASGLCFVSWTVWLLVRLEHLDKWTDWTPAFATLVRSDTISWKLAFLEWGMPVGIASELFLMMILCWFQMKQADMALALSSPSSDDQARAEQVYLVSQVKLLGALLCVGVLFLWIGASLSITGDNEFGQEREDLRDELVGVTSGIFLSLIVWLVYNLGPEKVRAAAETSKAVQSIVDLAKGEWAKACYLFMCAPLLFLYSLFARCKDPSDMPYSNSSMSLVSTDAQEEVATPSSRQATGGDVSSVDVNNDYAVVRLAKLFAWCQNELVVTTVITKAQILGIGYVVMTAAAKATLMMLAWTNEALKAFDVGMVSLAIFAVGTFLFLLPPTPGPPVYIVTGIVVTASAQHAGWHPVEAVTWSVFVGFAIKMAFAAAAQKFIGGPLAQSTAVRSIVRVHTAEIRAIEMILKDPSLTAAKVAILIGGPDWPVAVLCGILQLPLGEIMLGLSPVLFQSVIPCTLSGALFVLFADDLKRQALGQSALTVAAALQIVAALVAGYYIQEALEKHWEVLQKERKEDHDVLELEKASAREEEQYRERTQLERLPWHMKLLLALGVLTAMAGAYLLLIAKPLFGRPCFKKFSMTSSIEESLGGNALSIVTPLGWVSVGLATASSLLLSLFYIIAGYEASSYDRLESDLMKDV